MASLKTEVDKLDIDKPVPVPVNLSKLSDVVKNNVAKKTEYNKLVAKVDNINTTNFVENTKYENDGPDFENKIDKIDKKTLDISSLVKKKTDFNTKVFETEGKIANNTGLATNSELTAVENKISDVRSLFKKQTITEKYQILKRNLLITIMINILLLQN